MAYDFPGREEKLAASAPEELPLLPLARDAVEFMATLLNELPEAQLSDPPSGPECRRVATFQIAALCLRSCSAVIVLVRTGYEPESYTLKRRGSECLDQVTAIVADATGETARQWIKGRGRKPRALAQRHGFVDSWDLFSQSSHAVSRAVAHLWNPPLYIPVAPSEQTIMLVPTRQCLRANALLFESADELCRIAAAIAQVYEGTVHLPSELFYALSSGRAWLEERRRSSGPAGSRP